MISWRCIKNARRWKERKASQRSLKRVKEVISKKQRETLYHQIFDSASVPGKANSDLICKVQVPSKYYQGYAFLNYWRKLKKNGYRAVVEKSEGSLVSVGIYGGDSIINSFAEEL